MIGKGGEREGMDWEIKERGRGIKGRGEGGSKRKEPELEDNTEPEYGMEDAIP